MQGRNHWLAGKMLCLYEMLTSCLFLAPKGSEKRLQDSHPQKGEGPMNRSLAWPLAALCLQALSSKPDPLLPSQSSLQYALGHSLDTGASCSSMTTGKAASLGSPAGDPNGVRSSGSCSSIFGNYAIGQPTESLRNSYTSSKTFLTFKVHWRQYLEKN